MDNSDAKNVWNYVNGFKVPALSKDDLDAWAGLVSELTFEQFQTAQRVAATRPVDELRFRPSVEQFKGYARAPRAQRIADYEPTSYEPSNARSQALAAAFFDQWRHIRRPIKPANERKIRTNAEIDAQEAVA